MRTELAALNDALPDLDWLQITDRKSGAIQLTALDAQLEPRNLRRLKKAVQERWGQVPLIDMVTEAALRTGMLGELTAVGSREALQRSVLALKGNRDNYDTRTGQRVGKPLPVRWVDIEDPDPAAAETNPLAVYEQGQEEGGATFARLEGCWYGDGSVFFNSTSGGDAELGQVWQYRPRGRSGGQLILLCSSRAARRCSTPPTTIQGDTRGPGNPDELGMTFAIWGPFEDGAL